MDRLKTLGAKALIIPFLIALLMVCLFGSAFMPMLMMKANNVSFGIVSLDEGGTTFAGTTNIGDTIVENVTSGDGLSAMGSDSSSESEDSSSSSSTVSSINWTVYDTEEQLMDAIDAGMVYGGMVIPKNFTSQQMLKATGLGNAPELTVYLNQAKNPMMVMMMQPTLLNMMNKNGMCVDVQILNEVDLGGASTMSSTMGLSVLVMPLYMASLMGGIISSVVLWPRGGRRKDKGKAALKQLAFALVYALFVAFGACCIDLVGGLNIPMDRLVPFLYVSCLTMLIPFMACADIKIPLAIVVGLLTMALGQGTIMYTPDMLPEPWSSYICPWIPQANIGSGLRSILYMGNGSFDTNMLPFIGWIAAGMVILVLAVLAKGGARVEGDKDHGGAESTEENAAEENAAEDAPALLEASPAGA